MNIKPVQKTNLCDYVVSQVKNLVIKGELKVGDKIPTERDLCTLFDVGRSSVREALKVLELQGLVRREKIGTFITADFSHIFEDTLTMQILLSDDPPHEIYETRLILEKEIIKLAARRRTEEDLEKMAEQLRKMENAIKDKDKDMFIKADFQFHIVVAESAKNSTLFNFYNTISDLVFKVQKQVAHDETVLKASFGFHKKILELISKKDSKGAASVLKEHLEDVETRLNTITEIKNFAKKQYSEEKLN